MYSELKKTKGKIMANELLGKRLQELRKKAGLTQDAAAERLHLKNKSTLASWEGGKSEPDIITFLKLCCEYGLVEARILAEALKVIDTAVWDFSVAVAENTENKEFSFCPYCGEKLK